MRDDSALDGAGLWQRRQRAKEAARLAAQAAVHAAHSARQSVHARTTWTR